MLRPGAGLISNGLGCFPLALPCAAKHSFVHIYCGFFFAHIPLNLKWMVLQLNFILHSTFCCTKTLLSRKQGDVFLFWSFAPLKAIGQGSQQQQQLNNGKTETHPKPRPHDPKQNINQKHKISWPTVQASLNPCQKDLPEVFTTFPE